MIQPLHDPEALARFSTEIAAGGLKPLWERRIRMAPGTACRPHRWRYAELKPHLLRAAGLIGKKEAERRVLMLENPSLAGSTFITPTLFAGMQIILPGEIAPAHRHSPAALRFIVEGEGAYTSVDGRRVPMSPGDFIVTRSWAWHDHGNLGTGPVVWLDGLDTPFAALFGAMFREDYPADVFPSDDRGDGPLLRYSYADTRIALDVLAKSGPPHPAHGYLTRYADPATGARPFTTMAVFMQRLPARFAGMRYRATDAKVLIVAEGRCEIELEGVWHTLAEHDVCAIPAWEPYRLRTADPATLFGYSDRAAQEALGLWREDC